MMEIPTAEMHPTVTWRGLGVRYGGHDGLFCDGATRAQVVKMCKGALVYLATPMPFDLVHNDGAFNREKCGELVRLSSMLVADLARDGVTVIAPLVMAEDMLLSDMSRRVVHDDVIFWQSWARPIAHSAQAVIVPAWSGCVRSRHVLAVSSHMLRRNARLFRMAWEGSAE